MVKLDLEINELVGLAELGKLSETQLTKFLNKASKEELESYIVKTAFGGTDDEEDLEEEKEEETDEDL